MLTVYVLVVVEPGQTAPVFESLRLTPGLVEVHEVMGPYDIVAKIEADTLQEVPPILGNHIRTIPGVTTTTSLVSFPQ